MTVVLTVLVAMLASGLFVCRRRIAALRRDLAVADAAARTDPLTGLANRAGLEHTLRRADGAAHGLILFDVDSFKSVNDHYGHAVGDQVLREIASRITAHAPPESCTARLGGDEFVVLLTPATLPIEDLAACASRIRDHVAAPITVGDANLRVTTSAGSAILPIEHADQLLPAADKAMYRAKRTAYRFTGGPGAGEHSRLARHAAERGDVGR